MEILLRDRILTRRFGSDVGLIVHLYVEHIIGFSQDIKHCKRTIHTCRNMIQNTLTTKYTDRLHKLLLDDIGYEFREIIQNVKYVAIKKDAEYDFKMCNVYNLDLIMRVDTKRAYCQINKQDTHRINNADSISNEDYLKIFEAYAKTTNTPCDLNKFVHIIKRIVICLSSPEYDNMFDAEELLNANELFCDDDLCDKRLCST